MSVLIAGDIHGEYDALHRQISPKDTLILLGDYLDFIDYDNLSGMIAEFVPREVIERVLGLIAGEQLDQAKREMESAAFSMGDLFDKLQESAHLRYERLFAGIPCETYLIYGNVDFPKILKEHLRPNTNLIEASALTLQGKRCGFVSGIPSMKYSFGMPGEFSREEYRKRLYGIGSVDHLFVHPPPAIPDLSFDTDAGRDEEGSEDLLAYIKAYFPKTVYFGHVHKPRKTEMEFEEKTQLINAGYFRKTCKLLTLEL